MAAPLTSLALSPPEPLGPGARHTLAGAMLGAHLLAGWALLQSGPVPPLPTAAATLQVEMIDGPSGAATQARPAPAEALPARPAVRPVPVPVAVAAAPQPPTPVAAPITPPAPAAELPAPPVRAAPPESGSAAAALPSAPVAANAAVAAASGPAPALAEVPTRSPAAVPAPPRQVVLSGSDWVRAPAYVYPRAAEKLREQGTVQVRIHFDAQGVPREVELLRSSGSARLDQEVLAKARLSRARPRLENGVPIEFRASSEAEFKF